MKKPSDLTKEELEQLVEQLQSILYLDISPDGDFWNRNKVWDSETIEYVAAVLVDAGLAPEEEASDME
jgi:hypothetical protein